MIGRATQGQLSHFWQLEGFEFPGLADPAGTTLDALGQEVNLLKLGRMPALLVLDQGSVVHYAHYGSSLADVADNETVLRQVRELVGGAG